MSEADGSKSIHFISAKYRELFTKVAHLDNPHDQRSSQLKKPKKVVIRAPSPHSTTSELSEIEKPGSIKSEEDSKIIKEEEIVDVAPRALKFEEMKPAAESAAYNISKINAAKWKEMHKTQRAKYLAYTIPDQTILDSIQKSQARASIIVQQGRQRKADEAQKYQEILLRKRDKYINEQEIQAAKKGILRSRLRREETARAQQELRVI